MNVPTPRVEILHLDPTRAELLFSFDASALDADVEIRAKVVGPRCPGVSTLEVSYPATALENQRGRYRVTIPEPNIWQPEHPFLYEAIFEFWQSGLRVAKSALPVGLRTS